MRTENEKGFPKVPYSIPLIGCTSILYKVVSDLEGEGYHEEIFVPG